MFTRGLRRSSGPGPTPQQEQLLYLFSLKKKKKYQLGFKVPMGVKNDALAGLFIH